jgi:hypothetical protein
VNRAHLAAPVSSAKTAFTVLLLDRQRPDSAKCLSSWLEEENARQVMARFNERYLIIASFATHREPRFIHCVEFLHDAEELLARLSYHLDVVALTQSEVAPKPIDFRFLLSPDDRQRVDGMLDAREIDQLRDAAVRGHA